MRAHSAFSPTSPPIRVAGTIRERVGSRDQNPLHQTSSLWVAVIS